MEAPIKNIKWVAYDLHLILEYKGDEVTIFESAKNSMALQELEKSNYFHIVALLSDGYKNQEKLQQLLDKVLVFYKK